MLERPRIIDVERKPSKCPVCGERVVDIIYGTGDMTEIEFVLEYRKEGIMGGDNIPRRPPIWACSCGCKRFRKVNPDGTDAPVKVKLLKNIRKAPADKINWETSMVERALQSNRHEVIHRYKVVIETELGEKETLSITAVSGTDAEDQAMELVSKGVLGLKGTKCVSTEVFDAPDLNE
ncbi:hypothetical protein O3689_02240 [Prevotella nigrescens]|jgi:hypothetical protein bacD2_21992|uniref:hypothetical protein n=1 Tax=Prevotella nigrescens TaxID=28133 RepID=UPI00352F4EE1